MQSGGWSYSKVGRDSSKTPSLRAAVFRVNHFVLCTTVSQMLWKRTIKWQPFLPIFVYQLQMRQQARCKWLYHMTWSCTKGPFAPTSLDPEIMIGIREEPSLQIMHNIQTKKIRIWERCRRFQVYCHAIVLGNLLSGLCIKVLDCSQHSWLVRPLLCMQVGLVFLVTLLSHRIGLPSNLGLQSDCGRVSCTGINFE